MLVLVVGCGSSTTNPHAMSTTRHDEAAESRDRGIATTEADCQAKRRNELTAGPGVPTSAAVDSEQLYTPCWHASDRRVIDAHTRAAADHRAASQALRDAESNACAGIAPEDRDLSPFERTSDIAAVEWSETGAIVTFRSVPRLSAKWLQRAVDCHLARSAALGHDLPEMPDCPLVPRGAHARVVAKGPSLAVELRGDNGAAIDEIRSRAMRLLER